MNEITCGTVLIDHPKVLEQADKYPYFSYTTENAKNRGLSSINVPKSFNGLDVWRDIISTQTHMYPIGGDWSYAVCIALAIKTNIYGYKNFYVSDFNKSRLLLTIKKPPIKTDPNIPSTLFTGQKSNIFNGYSLYDGLEFCYERGISSLFCFSGKMLKAKGIDLDEIARGTFEDKIKLLEKYTSKDITKPKLLDDTHCISSFKKDGVEKYMARRTFSITSIINIGVKGGNIQDNIEDIKKEIYHFGPVIAGMLVYDDFLKLNAKEIYKGPSQNSKVIGGTSLVILGWGQDENLGEYWIAMTSWDSFASLSICRIKTGIEKCMLERNAIAFIPKVPNTVTLPELDMKKNNPGLKPVEINPYTFYTPDTTMLLKNKILVNKYGEYDIIPLITNPSKLIPYTEFNAANIQYYSVSKTVLTNKKSDNDNYYLIEIGILIIVCIFLFIYFYKHF
jgi:hypothetical protein